MFSKFDVLWKVRIISRFLLTSNLKELVDASAFSSETGSWCCQLVFYTVFRQQMCLKRANLHCMLQLCNNICYLCCLCRLFTKWRLREKAKARSWQTWLCFHKWPVSTYFRSCQPYGLSLSLCCCAEAGTDSM